LINARSFLGKSAIYGLGSLLTQATGFILLPLYTRALAPAEFGTLEILTRVGEALVLLLMVNGLRQAVLALYNQSKDEEERRRVIGSSMFLMLAVGLVGMGATVATASPVCWLLRAGPPSLLALAVFATIVDTLTIVPLALIQARMESVTFSVTSLALVLVKLSLAILMVAVLKMGLWGVFAATAITSSLFGVGLSLREIRRSRPRIDVPTLHALTRFAWPFLITALCFFVLNFGDRFFLLKFADQRQLGLYGIGYRLAMVVGVFSRAPLQMVWSAQMYEVARELDAGRLFGQMFTRILAVYVFVGLGVCLLQDEVILVLCGRPYADAAPIIAPVVLAYFFLAAGDLMDAGLFVRRQTSRKVGVALASAAVALGLYALLIPGYKALGAALATLVGFAFHALITFKVTQRVFPVSYETKRVAAVLGAAVLLWSISRCLPPGWWSAAGRVSLWACWPAVLWIGGIMTPEEKRQVRSGIRSVLDRLQPVAVTRTVENPL
jgi:O-antigen/teichoic acid export membrane protein